MEAKGCFTQYVLFTFKHFCFEIFIPLDVFMGLPELGTANLNSLPQPQIPQNCKRCSATANPQVCDRFAVTFRTSATANAHSTSANLYRNIYCYYVFVMTFFTFEIKFCHRPDVDLQQKKKVINSRSFTSNPEDKSVHFFRAVLPRIRQHCLLVCGFAVGN